MSIEGNQDRFNEDAESLAAARTQQEIQAAEARRERRREVRQAGTLESLGQQWRDILEQDQVLVQASDGLFGDPKEVNKATLIHDGEWRPGKGMAEVHRVYADSPLIPIGATDNDLETFGILRLWGIFRGADTGGAAISTKRLYFGESRRGRDFFDVFDFDSYDISYVIGAAKKPTGAPEEPQGKDLLGRWIWGRLVTTNTDGDPTKVDDVLRFSTLYTAEQMRINHTFDRLADAATTHEERKTGLMDMRKFLKSTLTRQQNYTDALDELILAATRAKIDL